MNKKARDEFIRLVWSHYHTHKRELPWRYIRDSYRIMVSEVMLQQTQAQRVIPKYNQFLARFPDVEALADAPLSDILQQWQGLGYNRRAKWLHQAAQNLRGHRGKWRIEDLQAQKGIGYNTAAAIVVYAFNEPLVFIETNIRTVFIYHFFSRDSAGVDDRDILPLVEATLDTANPREWYWALMDYGVHLKKSYRNPSRRSKHYATQTPFEGSLRQLRARLLREILSAGGGLSRDDIQQLFDDARTEQALETLIADGLVQKHEQFYSIPSS